MGLGRCQTSITVGCAPITHANSPTYTTIPPITMPRSPLARSPHTRKSSIGTLPHPPAKDLPSSTRPPPLARATDPITRRTEQWLSWPIATLDSRFGLGWTRYIFALTCWGQVARWREGQRVSMSHFLERSLERARLILARHVPRPPRPAIYNVPNSPLATRPLPTGQTSMPRRIPHQRTSLLPLPPPPPLPLPTIVVAARAPTTTTYPSRQAAPSSEH